MSAGKKATLLIAAVGVALVGIWLAARSTSTSARIPSASNGVATASGGAQLPEFLAIDDRLKKSKNEIMGRGPMDEIEPQIAASDASSRLGRELRTSFAKELLRVGLIDSSITILDAAIAGLDGDPSAGIEEVEIVRLRALAHLRKAEIENCVNRHNRDCCIAPLAGGGVHSVSEPASRAKRDYLDYLKRLDASAPGGRLPADDPRRLAGAWLLNISAMALGEYPEGVPEQYRVSPRTFESEADIGRFTDVAKELGVDCFDHAGGAIVDDMDGDGLLDIVTSGSHLNEKIKAFRNRGDGTFEDVATKWRLDDQTGGLHIAGADYDNDGDLDILVPRGAWMLEDGRIRKSLLRNDGAQGFTDVTRIAGVDKPPTPTQAVVWADFDGDGWLDFYVGNESRVETNPGSPNIPSQLYKSNGDGTFTDIAVAAGVTNDRYAKGACAGDYDEDGDMDLYVSNLGPNRLYRNDGGMRFVDVAPELGVIEPKGRSFACWFFDFENDGDLDLWCNAYDASVSSVAASAMGKPFKGSPPALYRNEGNGTFTDITKEAGVAKAWLPMGCSFGDFDNDGWLDIYLGTGDPLYESLMPNIALRNDRGRRFQDITTSAGLGHLQKGHGTVFVDLDDDGDQDMYHQLGGFYPGDGFGNSLFVNPGHGNRFLKVELVGTKTNRQGIGARLAVQFQTPRGSRTVHRSVGSVSSFGQVPRRQDLGLADATTITAVEVWWPVSGNRQRFESVPLDSSIRITEGAVDYETMPLHPVILGARPGA
jgi:hypothetical protein